MLGCSRSLVEKAECGGLRGPKQLLGSLFPRLPDWTLSLAPSRNPIRPNGSFAASPVMSDTWSVVSRNSLRLNSLAWAGQRPFVRRLFLSEKTVHGGTWLKTNAERFSRNNPTTSRLVLNTCQPWHDAFIIAAI